MNKNLIITVSLLIFAVMLILFAWYYTESKKPENAVRSYLEEKYQEDFQNTIKFEKSIPNPDIEGNVDGTNVITVEGKGSTEYFKIFSEKDDLDFEVIVDTGTWEIHDTFALRKDVRDHLLSFFSAVNERLSDHIVKISIDDRGMNQFEEVSGVDEIKERLSRIPEIDSDSDSSTAGYPFISLEITLDQASLPFCQENTDLLHEINDLVIQTNNSLKYNFFIFILTGSDGKQIVFDGVSQEIYVYDLYAAGEVWGQELDEYIEKAGQR